MEQTIEFFKTYLGRNRTAPIEGIIGADASHNVRQKEFIKLSLNPVSVSAMLGAVAFFLVLASVGVLAADYFTGYNSTFVHKLVKLFDVDLELNVPTFFSVLLLTIASLLLTGITYISKKEKAPHRLEWTLLSVGFLFMAFDEMASVHERLIEPMRAILGIENLGAFYYAWVVPAIALVGFLAIAFLKFMIHLPAKTRWAFMIAGAMYLGGAVGLELVEGMLGMGNLTYVMLTTVEESLEMGGVIVFIWALLVYISDNHSEIGFRFNMSGKGASTGKNYPLEDLGLQS